MNSEKVEQLEKITKTIITENDKITAIIEKEPADSKSTSSKVIQTKESIILQTNKNHHHS